jgi:hypothetical protein
VLLSAALLAAACSGVSARSEVNRTTLTTARAVATQDPCGLLRAIRAQPSSSTGDPLASIWKISLRTECCEEPRARSSLRPAVMTWEPAGPEVLGWGSACEGGPGGPVGAPGLTVAFDYISLIEKDPSTIALAITPAYVEITSDGKRGSVVTQGCPDFEGEASLSR